MTPRERITMEKIKLASGVRLKDELIVEHFRGGKLIGQDSDVADLLVNAGLEYMAKLLNGVSTTPFKYAAIGTGTTAPAVGDTTLEAEITTGGGSRAQAQTIEYEASYKAKWVHTFTFTSSFAVTEEGLFDAAGPPPAGHMLVRHTFTVKNVESGDSIQFTNKVTVSRET